jgi:hypothetical protein
LEKTQAWRDAPELQKLGNPRRGGGALPLIHDGAFSVCDCDVRAIRQTDRRGR